jgi:hypothetical protein
MIDESNRKLEGRVSSGYYVFVARVQVNATADQENTVKESRERENRQPPKWLDRVEGVLVGRGTVFKANGFPKKKNI